MDVWPYLTDVLRHLPAIAPNDTAALEALLPDRQGAAHPEHPLEQREEKESRETQARRCREPGRRRHGQTGENRGVAWPACESRKMGYNWALLSRVSEWQ